MFSQKEIDDVLAEAEDAVNDLVQSTGAATVRSAGSAPSVRPRAAAAGLAEPWRRLLRLRVPVIVRLASHRMPVADILTLSPGAILEFDTPVDQELALLVNNKPIGTGEAVKVGENFGLKVRFVGDVRTRIATLGGA